MSAENRGWGQGWPNCQSANIVKVTCGGNGLKLPVRSAIAPLVPPLVLDLETARARPFRPDWSWGYSCRAIAGTTTPSNHSWGLAIDLDAPENPQLTKTKHGASHTLRKTFPGGQVLRSTMPDDVLAIARKHGFEWGGLFAKPDPMHFEFLGTPEDAANRAQNPGSMPMPLRGPSPSPTPAGGLTRTYTVKAGDTLSQIGQRLGVKWRKLAADNNVPPPTFIIHPGQVLWF